MGRHLKITIASILALAIAGCSGEEEQQTVAPTPTVTADSQGKKPAFEDPVVPGKNTLVAQAPSTLIQPTNPTERVGIVAKGRTDPFDDIISPVVIRTNIDSNTTGSNGGQRLVPVLPPLPGVSSRNTASIQRARRSAVISATAGGSRSGNYPTAGRNRSGSSVTARASQGRNISRNSNSAKANSRQLPKQTAKKPGKGSISPTVVVPKIMPGVIPQPDIASVLPPPPQPKLAQAVLVSGVIQVGNQPQAIIKVPSEPTSRYVQAGQRLASGLLVKRIEMNEGSEPIVILEQYGIEVARMVGESPMGAVEPSTASTSNPVSTLLSLPTASVGAS